MSRLEKITKQTNRRQNRTRKSLKTSAKRPRLSVSLSNTNITAQIIDDQKGQTLAYSSSLSKDASGKSLTEKSVWVGDDIAKKAKTKKVKQVVFDRGPKQYHGRVKALAEAAKKAGLEF